MEVLTPVLETAEVRGHSHPQPSWSEWGLEPGTLGREPALGHRDPPPPPARRRLEARAQLRPGARWPSGAPDDAQPLGPTPGRGGGAAGGCRGSGSLRRKCRLPQRPGEMPRCGHLSPWGRDPQPTAPSPTHPALGVPASSRTGGRGKLLLRLRPPLHSPRTRRRTSSGLASHRFGASVCPPH